MSFVLELICSYRLAYERRKSIAVIKKKINFIHLYLLTVWLLPASAWYCHCACEFCRHCGQAMTLIAGITWGNEPNCHGSSKKKTQGRRKDFLLSIHSPKMLSGCLWWCVRKIFFMIFKKRTPQSFLAVSFWNFLLIEICRILLCVPGFSSWFFFSSIDEI